MSRTDNASQQRTNDLNARLILVYDSKTITENIKVNEMRKLPKSIVNQVVHAIITPSNRLVVTAPRQSGMTKSMIDYATKQNHKVVLVFRTIEISRHIKHMFEFEHGKSDNVFFASASTIRNDSDGTVSFDCIGVGRKYAIEFDEFIFDDAHWLNYQPIIKSLHHDTTKKIMILSTGSNIPEWHKKVNDLCNMQYTAIFVNPVRHPLHRTETTKQCGEAMYKREFEINTYEPELIKTCS